jgi:hypothetical protein
MTDQLAGRLPYRQRISIFAEHPYNDPYNGAYNAHWTAKRRRRGRHGRAGGVQEGCCAVAGDGGYDAL